MQKNKRMSNHIERDRMAFLVEDFMQHCILLIRQCISLILIFTKTIIDHIIITMTILHLKSCISKFYYAMMKIKGNNKK